MSVRTGASRLALRRGTKATGFGSDFRYGPTPSVRSPSSKAHVSMIGGHVGSEHKSVDRKLVIGACVCLLNISSAFPTALSGNSSVQIESKQTSEAASSHSLPWPHRTPSSALESHCKGEAFPRRSPQLEYQQIASNPAVPNRRIHASHKEANTPGRSNNRR